MKKYPIALYCDHPQVHLECRVVARLARVSEEFIVQCEHEDLVATRIMLHGRKGLCCADVRKMKLIRHLHQDMGLDLEAVDFVLRYRDQLKKVKRQLDTAERRLRQKEEKHLAEIRLLRQRLENVSE